MIFVEHENVSPHFEKVETLMYFISTPVLWHSSSTYQKNNYA